MSSKNKVKAPAALKEYTGASDQVTGQAPENHADQLTEHGDEANAGSLAASDGEGYSGEEQLEPKTRPTQRYEDQQRERNAPEPIEAEIRNMIREELQPLKDAILELAGHGSGAVAAAIAKLKG